MRRSALVSMLLMCAVLAVADSVDTKTCPTAISMIDARTGESLAGVIRVRTGDGEAVAIPGLLRRGQGLDDGLPINDWFVLPRTSTVELPAGALSIDAFSGLESERAHLTLDLSGKSEATIRVALTRFHRRKQDRLVSGNTHLHLQKITRAECDRYLEQIPRSDDLDVMFLSYLERAVADREYTSNHYSKVDLAELTAKSGVVFGNGEEHRHNFAGFGQGYGHVMLLNIDELIQPVSIGPGIMKTGTDGIPLTRGIQQAKRDGATAIWCHNVFGYEADPNWILGRLDAMNIYDGGQRAGYRERFYQLLNAGMKIPFSTGTDWFMYDFSRVYVRMDEPVTVDNWLKALSAGRSFITNGPLFQFQVDKVEIGGTVQLKQAGSVAIHGDVEGRVDFKRAELVHNGRVVATATTRPVGGHFVAEIKKTIRVSGPGWFALRIPPPIVDGKPNPASPLNEYGRRLYGHTSPVYVEVGGRNGFNRNVAAALLASMKEARQSIDKNGVFEDSQARARVLDVYDDASSKLASRIEESR